MGRKDLQKKGYLYDSARFADLVNGVVCAGRQVLAASDLTDMDTQSGQFGIARYDGVGTGGSRADRNENRSQSKNDSLKDRHRDLVRRAAFGVNFVVIGIENQEETDYLMPLRRMSYDAAEYERQAAQTGRKVRNRKDVTKAEFLSGFTKESRLHPCVTIVLYYGEQWDGATSLWELLALEDIPLELQQAVNDYKVYLCEVRKFENTEVFKTDIKQVFDCLRYAGEPEKLYRLVSSDPAYRAMEPDTYDVIAEYIGASELMKVKEYREDGKVDMSNAAEGLIEMGRRDGMERGIEQGIERGIRQGIKQGVEQGMMKAILELLEDFGQVPKRVSDLIWHQKDPATLRRWHKLAARAGSLAEFEQNM